jgi:hypothetical protein
MERKTATLKEIFEKLSDLPTIQMGELNILNEIKKKTLDSLTLSDLSYVNHLSIKYGKELGIEVTR